MLRKGEKRQERYEEAKGRQERKVDAQEVREEDKEDEERENSMHEESYVSNRHMTWWRKAWWIRVDNGPHLRTAKRPRNGSNGRDVGAKEGSSRKPSSSNSSEAAARRPTRRTWL